MKITAWAVVVVALAAGCGGTKPAAAPKLTPSPSSTVTVSQFASVIAQSSPPIRRNAASIRDCAVGAMAPSTCTIVRFSSTLDPKTLVLRIESVMQDGTPPAEIADLVQRTVTDAREAARVARSHVGYATLSFAQNTLVEDLDAWRPYGG